MKCSRRPRDANSEAVGGTTAVGMNDYQDDSSLNGDNKIMGADEVTVAEFTRADIPFSDIHIHNLESVHIIKTFNISFDLDDVQYASPIIIGAADNTLTIATEKSRGIYSRNYYELSEAEKLSDKPDPKAYTWSRGVWTVPHQPVYGCYYGKLRHGVVFIRAGITQNTAMDMFTTSWLYNYGADTPTQDLEDPRLFLWEDCEDSG